MNNVENIQSAFFEEIKGKLDNSTSLVEEVAELLNVSTDSAYRRLRNKTYLTFQETAILANQFNISLDKYINPKEDLVTFSYQTLDEDKFNFTDYLNSIVSDLKQIKKGESPEITYFAVDIPLPQLLFVPEVAAFKLFFWEKTILNFEKLNKSKFHFTFGNEEVNKISREIRDLYISIPSKEIYSPETIQTTLKQIQYYLDAGYFESTEIAVALCDKFHQLIEHIRDQAAEGEKTHKKDPSLSAKYELYYNEVIYSDTSIIAENKLGKFSYLANNGLRRIVTNNEQFFDSSKRSVTKLLKKASLLSGASEKERNMVFNSYLNSITELKSSIK